MAYIGRQPTVGNFRICDAISVVDGQAAYTMQVGGVNVSPESANHMLVSLNGILQAPNSSFTVSSSTITFASNLVTGDVIDFIQILGNVLDLGVPSDNTVSLAKLTATGTKDSTTFLRGDNTFDTPPLGGITEADMFRLTTDVNSGTSADVTTNWERVDDASFSKIGTGLTESSGIFSFPSTGIYLISFNANLAVSLNEHFTNVRANVTQNNSTYDPVAVLSGSSDGNRDFHGSPSIEFIVDVTDTSNVKFKFTTAFTTSGTRLRGDSTESETAFTCIRLGDT